MKDKKCSTCLRLKPVNAFALDKTVKDGLRASCKACVNFKARNKYKQFPEKSRVLAANWRKKNPEKNRAYQLKKDYKISLEEYLDFLNKQQNCCNICRRHQNEFKRALSVDHCHKTGKVRGLLCNNCNRGIGYLRDSVGILQNAIKHIVGNADV